MKNEDTFEDLLDEMRGDFFRDGKHAKDVESIMRHFADKAEYLYNRNINRRIPIDDSCVAQIALQLDSHIKAIKVDSSNNIISDNESSTKNMKLGNQIIPMTSF